MYIYTYIYIYIYVYTYIYVHMYNNIYVYANRHIHDMHTCDCIHIVCPHTGASDRDSRTRSEHPSRQQRLVRLYVYLCICVCVCV